MSVGLQMAIPKAYRQLYTNWHSGLILSYTEFLDDKTDNNTLNLDAQGFNYLAANRVKTKYYVNQTQKSIKLTL